MRGVQGEERAAILEEHTGVPGDDARTELVIEALDHRHRVAAGVGGHDRDGVPLAWASGHGSGGAPRDPASPARETLRVETPVDRHRDCDRIGEVAVSILEGELRCLNEHVDVVGVVEGGDVEALDQREDREGGEPLGRWREAHDLTAAIGHADRVAPVGAVRGEVVERQWTADAGRRVRDAACERAPVEFLRTVGRDGLQRSGQVVLDEAAALEPVRVIDRPQRRLHLVRRVIHEEVGRGRRHAPLPGRRRKALPRVGDRVGEEPLPVDPRAQALSTVSVRLPPARDGARDGEGRRPAARGDRCTVARAVGLEARRAGGAPGGVESEQVPALAVVNEPDVVAANAIHVGVDHGDGDRGGDGGVEGTASGPEDGQPRLGRQRVRRRDEAVSRVSLDASDHSKGPPSRRMPRLRGAAR